jgi:SAM-dependent methyltransferase
MKIFDFIKQVFQGKSIYRILFNWQVQKYCQNLNGKCLDLAGGKNPSYYRYWSFDNSAELIKTDLNGELKVDLNNNLDFEDNSIDNILFFNAIYIIKEPEKLMKEINRILKKDGKLFIASPFIFNEAKEPDDFRRLTSQGLEKLLKESGFSDFEIIPFGERFTAGIHLWHSFFLFNFIRLIIFTKAILFDKLIPKKIKKLHPCPLGYFVIAKKI